MVRVAVTGAAGNVGRQALPALEDHEVTAFTHQERDDIDSTVLDVTDAEAFTDALADHDALVHLAANPSPDANWEDVRAVNVDGVYNAYEAAVANDVDRVVFASTNHVVQMYNIDDPERPETLTTGDVQTVDPDDPPRPDSYYGITKVAGEAFGSYYADRHGLEVLNLRIGWLMTADELRDTQDAPENEACFARAMWLSPRDCRDAVRSALTAPVSEACVTVNVVSRNDDRYLSITPTLRRIGYTPRDNATETLQDV